MNYFKKEQTKKTEKLEKPVKQSSLWIQYYLDLISQSFKNISSKQIPFAPAEFIWLAKTMLSDDSSFQKRILWSFARFSFLTDSDKIPLLPLYQEESKKAKANILTCLKQELIIEAEAKKFIGGIKADILRKQLLNPASTNQNNAFFELVTTTTMEQCLRQYKNFQKKPNQKLLDDLMQGYKNQNPAEIKSILEYALILSVKPLPETKELDLLLKHYNRLIKQTLEFKGSSGVNPEVLVLPDEIISYVVGDNLIDKKHNLLLFSPGEAESILGHDDYGEAEEEFLCSLIHLYQQEETNQIDEFFQLGIAEIVYQKIRPYGNTTADSQAAKQVCQALLQLSKDFSEPLELKTFFLENNRFEQVVASLQIEKSQQEKTLQSLKSIYKQAVENNLSDKEVLTAVSLLK